MTFPCAAGPGSPPSPILARWGGDSRAAVPRKNGFGFLGRNAAKRAQKILYRTHGTPSQKPANPVALFLGSIIFWPFGADPIGVHLSHRQSQKLVTCIYDSRHIHVGLKEPKSCP